MVYGPWGHIESDTTEQLLAAAAVLCALAKVARLDGFDMLHDEILQ